MTLSELLISCSILILVSGAFLVVVETVQHSVAKQQDHSVANDEARMAIERLDREIRSGNVLYDPAAESPAYYSIRVFTQANATTRTPPAQCVQWRISGQQLQRRSWAPNDVGNASSWAVVASNVVNADPGILVPAFEIDPDPLKSGRTLDVTLVVDGDPNDSRISPIRIETSLTGRNTALGYPAGICSPVPA